MIYRISESDGLVAQGRKSIFICYMLLDAAGVKTRKCGHCTECVRSLDEKES